MKQAIKRVRRADLNKGETFLDVHGDTWTKVSYKGDRFFRAVNEDGHESMFVETCFCYTCTPEEALADLRLRLENVADPNFEVDVWASRSMLDLDISRLEARSRD